MAINCQQKNNSVASIGERVKKLRKAKKLTQAQLAEKLELTQGYIGHLESGRNHPTLDQIMNMAIIFDCNMIWLATGEGEMFVQDEPPKLNPDLSNGALLVVDEQHREMVGLMASAPGREAELLALVKGYLAGGKKDK